MSKKILGGILKKQPLLNTRVQNTPGKKPCVFTRPFETPLFKTFILKLSLSNIPLLKQDDGERGRREPMEEVEENGLEDYPLRRNKTAAGKP